MILEGIRKALSEYFDVFRLNDAFLYRGLSEQVSAPEVIDPSFKGGGSSLSDSMILPGRNKQFDRRLAFWDELWLQAARALRTADEIVVIGYSLPPADERARGLLFREGNKKSTVSIYCGDDSARIVSEFANEGFSVKPGTGYFEDWLRPIPSTTALPSPSRHPARHRIPIPPTPPGT